MAKLTTQKRNALATSQFALPEKRAFPVNDATHARMAKSGASRALHAGHITAEEKKKIDAKADRKLGKDPNHEAHAYDWRKEGKCPKCGKPASECSCGKK